MKRITILLLAGLFLLVPLDTYAHIYEPHGDDLCHEDGSEQENRMCPG